MNLQTWEDGFLSAYEEVTSFFTLCMIDSENNWLTKEYQGALEIPNLLAWRNHGYSDHFLSRRLLDEDTTWECDHVQVPSKLVPFPVTSAPNMG